MRIQVAIGVLLVLGLAQQASAKGKDAVAIAAEDMKWVEVPDTGGVQVAVVKGDMNKGAHEAFAKFPAGVEHPLHTHTNAVTVVVISGTFTYGPEAGPAKSYGSGSYLSIPGGLKHTSGCAAGAPCILFQSSPGKFDFKPVAPPKAAAAPPAK